MEKVRKTVTIEEMAQLVVKLTNDLNDDAKAGRNSFGSICRESGIYGFLGRMYSGRYDEASLNYQISEECVVSDAIDYERATTIYDKGTKCRQIFLINEVIGLVWFKVSAYVRITKDNREALNAIKKGDKILINGPFNINWWYGGCEPKSFLERNPGLKALLNTDIPPYCSDLSMNVYCNQI